MMAPSWFCASLRNSALLAAWLPLAAVAQSTVPSAASVAPAARVAPVEAAPANKAAGATEPAPGAPAWTLVKTIVLPNPGPASLDRRGVLYLADRDNNLRQLGRDGQPLNTYSPTQPGHVAVIEAWNQNSLLAFYDDRQQVLLLDRFLAPLAEIRLAD